jgi:anti-anti-sigma factor
MGYEHEDSADGVAGLSDDPDVRVAALSACSRATPFRIEVGSEGDRTLVAPMGELDLATTGLLDDILGEIDEAGFDRLVLDLRGVSFMDCSGLRIVLKADACAREKGRRLQAVCNPGQFGRLLALTGVDEQLEIASPVAPHKGVAA